MYPVTCMYFSHVLIKKKGYKPIILFLTFEFLCVSPQKKEVIPLKTFSVAELQSSLNLLHVNYNS